MRLMSTMTRRTGRWAAWLLLDVCQPGEQQADKLPSRRALIWLTRSVSQEQVDHFWSESGRAGVVPAVESSLFRIALRRWWGAPITLWRTQVCVQVWAGQVVTLEHDRLFADEGSARQDFAMHGDRLRRTLVGRSQYPHELQEADNAGNARPTAGAAHAAGRNADTGGAT